MSLVLLFVILVVAGLMLFTVRPKNPSLAGNTRAVGGLMLAAALLLVLYKGIVVVPAGHVGVVDFFGNVSKNTLKPGINFVNPLAKVVRLSIKTQEVKENVNVPSQEGLTINLDVSVLFHLDPEKADDVYKTVGVSYTDILVVPQFRSVIRTVTAGYEAKALYTSLREKLSMSILKDLEAAVAARGIVIESTPLRSITMPQKVTEAIEEKLKAEQESQRMQFVLEKERLEADRKRIEAQGIADFQKTVAQGLNEQLLRWKGIEATERLATSGNSKIIVVGGRDGLPLILNSDK